MQKHTQDRLHAAAADDMQKNRAVLMKLAALEIYTAAVPAVLIKWIGPRVPVFIITFSLLFFAITRIRISLSIVRGEEVETKDIGDVSGTKLNYPILCLWLGLYKVICLIPSVFLLIFVLAADSIPVRMILIAVSFASALLVSPVLYAPAAAAIYVSADHQELRTKDILYTSRVYMSGNRLRWCRLVWSYIPQVLLAIVTLGIYGIWCVPQMSLAYARFYTELGRSDVLRQKKKKKKKTLGDRLRETKRDIRSDFGLRKKDAEDTDDESGENAD